MRSTVEGSEAVRPNEFYAVRAIIILQLEVSAIADDPLPASGSFPPFRGTRAYRWVSPYENTRANRANSVGVYQRSAKQAGGKPATQRNLRPQPLAPSDRTACHVFS